MYSEEIKQLLELKEYIISVEEYSKILYTSPQINFIKYDSYDDNFSIGTDDRYNFKFKVKTIDKV